MGGNAGPDHGTEGIVIKCVDFHGKNQQSHQRRLANWTSGLEVDLHINAQTPYQTSLASQNGFDIQKPYYAMITVDAGTNVSLGFKYYARNSNEIYVVPEVAVTIFDLDTDVGGTAMESVTVNGFTNAVLSPSTELSVNHNEGGGTTFSATTEGTSDDNPTKPMELTTQQRNRGVTFEFLNFTHVVVTLAVSPGNRTGDFMFVGRPSLRCIETNQETENYVTGETGAAGCPIGMDITSSAKCKEAIESLGLEAEPTFVGTNDNFPTFCSVNKTGTPAMIFNAGESGKSHSQLTPVCKEDKVVIVPGVKGCTVEGCCVMKIIFLALLWTLNGHSS